VVLSQEIVRALRPPADAFAEAVLAGARQLATRDRDGSMVFRTPEVEARHQALRAALRQGLPAELVAAVETASQDKFERFLDRLVRGWLVAETDITHFVITDRRGDGGFVFDLLRAELHDLSIDIEVEPRPSGELLVETRSRWRIAAPVVGCVWLGAFAGLLIELGGGVPGAGTIGAAIGLAVGLMLGLRLMLAAPRADCSECGSTMAVTCEVCESCGTSFALVEEGIEAAPGGEKREVR